MRTDQTRANGKWFYGYWIVGAAFITLALGSGFIFYGFSVINKPVADEFSWSRAEVTAAFFYLVAGTGISPLVGRFVDKHGSRLMLLLGTATLALAMVLLGIMSSLWMFYLLHLLLGVGYALTDIVPVGAIVAAWFSRLRGTMQGLAFSGMGLGGLALAPLIGNYVIPAVGWRTAYMVMAALLLVIMVPLVVFVFKERPIQLGLAPFGDKDGPRRQDDSDTHVPGASLKQAVRMPSFWIISVTLVIYGIAACAALQNQVSILNQQGFATESAVFAVGVVALFSGIAKPLFGLLCDRITPKTSTAISFLMIGGALITMANASTLAHIWIYAVLMGLGQGAWAPNLTMLSSRYFGRQHHAAILGALYVAFMVGEGIGPMLAGFAYDQTGSYKIVILILALLTLASAPVIMAMKTRAKADLAHEVIP